MQISCFKLESEKQVRKLQLMASLEIVHYNYLKHWKNASL